MLAFKPDQQKPDHGHQYNDADNYQQTALFMFRFFFQKVTLH
jgi:hypothetical protein